MEDLPFEPLANPREVDGLPQASSRLASQLLLIDIDLAISSLDDADAAHEPARRQRSRESAARAHDVVRGMLENGKFTEEEARGVRSRLADLARRLASE